MRDDFLETTRRTLALQANYRCSFPSCGVATSGPSDESPAAVASTGMAAHIHAASPGGPRYLLSMTPVERKDISNGIWMCRNHGTLIDEDYHTYTADAIREMKRRHLAAIADEQAGRSTKVSSNVDLIALGPDLVVIGELVGVSLGEWSIQVHHFVVGNIATLVEFPERFAQTRSSDRYVLVNALGDGRQLTAPPSFERTATGHVVRCLIATSCARVDAHKLPTDWALDDAHDLFAVNGRIAEVSGVNALPQRIKSSMSMQPGESPSHPTFGARLTRYFELFRDSIWFSQLLKLEVVRQASIPYDDPILNQSYTPLMSVRSVRSVEVVGPGQKKDWITLKFDLEVEGVGDWQRSIEIFIPQQTEQPPDVDDGGHAI